MASAGKAQYLSPYKEAHRLLLQIEQSGHTPLYKREQLDRLSDTEIEPLIPLLKQFQADNLETEET